MSIVDVETSRHDFVLEAILRLRLWRPGNNKKVTYTDLGGHWTSTELMHRESETKVEATRGR